MESKSTTTRDHDEIRSWVDEQEKASGEDSTFFELIEES